MRLYDSLYETALKQEIPRPVVDELVRIFANDVDFGRAVSGGDSFEAFYDDSEEGEGHISFFMPRSRPATRRSATTGFRRRMTVSSIITIKTAARPANSWFACRLSGADLPLASG